MNIVFVRHQGDRRPYLFAVPEGVTLAKGAEVVCDTCKGETTGKCFTPSVDMSRSAVEYFGPLLGASFPLKSVVGEVRHQVVRFPAKEDRPTEKTEPKKLYCVKSYEPGEWCTKGKIYDSTPDFRVTYDSGYQSYNGSDSIEEFHKRNPETGAPLFPLVKRPAKVGEWVLVTDKAGHGYEKGRIYQVCFVYDGRDPLGKGSVYFKLDGNGTVRPDQYLVLDGYKGDGE